MSQQTQTEKKMPDGRVDEFFRPDDETIPPEQMKARLNGTESDRTSAREQKTDWSSEITSKTKTTEPKAEKKTPSETEPEEKKQETSMPAKKPSAETSRSEATSMPENPGKTAEELRKMADTETSTRAERTETTYTEMKSTETSTTKKKKSSTPQRQERRPSQPSEDSGNFPKTSESKDPDTSSLTNTSMGNALRTASELHRWAKERELESENSLLKDSISSLKAECNDLVREQTEKVEALRKEITEESVKLECDMRELRRCLVATMQAYSECLSLKTNAIHTRMEESLDRLEMNSDSLRGETGRLIAEDRAMICEIPSIVEKELTRAANETSDFVDKALEVTVGKYTDEIKLSTKFLKKQVEERKKASRFEKVTDVLMRVFCPMLALGTFVLACVVTCFV